MSGARKYQRLAGSVALRRPLFCCSRYPAKTPMGDAARGAQNMVKNGIAIFRVAALMMRLHKRCLSAQPGGKGTE